MSIEYRSGLLSFELSPIIHCVSADLAMGAGFAAQVPDEHKRLARMWNPDKHVNWLPPGLLIRTETKTGSVIFHAVTKEKCWHKPTFDDFKTAISEIEEHELSEVFCPKIGSGLDMLPWDRVESFLKTLKTHFVVFDGKRIQ